MKSVGAKSNILRVSVELKAGLESAGRKRGFPPEHVLFRQDGKSAGVFLVCKGKVLMGVRDMPKLDRVFSAGSLLGLPATFTGHPYSLTAVAVVVGYSSRTTGRISAAHARAPQPLSRSNRYAGMRANFYPVGAGGTVPPDCQSELATISNALRVAIRRAVQFPLADSSRITGDAE